MKKPKTKKWSQIKPALKIVEENHKPLLDEPTLSHPRVVTTNARKPGLSNIERYRIVASGVAHHKATRGSHSGSGFGAETAEASEMLLLYQELAFKVANEAAGVG